MRTLIFSLSLVCLVQVTLSQANEPAASPAPAATSTKPEQVRAAIAHSLPFMESEGQAWMKKRGCVSCHQIPSMVWTFNAAKHQGFPVDAAKLSEWNEWALKGAFNGSLVYKLPEKAFAALLKDGVSEAEVNKLKGMKDREFLKEDEFWHVVGEQLAAEVTPKLKEQILKAATKPGPTPGGGDGTSAVYAALLHTGLLAAVKAPDQAQTAFFEGLVHYQLPDGLWKSSGQFFGMNRPKEESNAVNTAWILLDLAYMDSLPQPVIAARDRALAALKMQAPGITTESTLVRLLLAHHANDAGQEAELLDKLLKLQRADGGWAYRAENPDSDALTTGQIVYGLSSMGRKPGDEPLQRAVAYLLKGQQPDGSWNVPWIHFNVENKKDHTDGNKIFSYWGSGWVVIGLLNSLEGSELATAAGGK